MDTVQCPSWQTSWATMHSCRQKRSHVCALHATGLEEAGAEGAGVDRVRAIVGRGRHSSAGEASLPRAVESYLLDRWLT